MKKSITPGFFTLQYLGAMAVCLLFIIKPGASIFYHKTSLDSWAGIPYAGYAFRYDLDVSPFIFRTTDILVHENGRQLNPMDGNRVVEEGMNASAISHPSTRTTHIYFASSDTSSPITKEDTTYTYHILSSLDRWGFFTWSSGDITRYAHPCDESSLLSFDEIKQAMVNRLSMDGFDVSCLP